jgi:hypothetical protein
VLAERQLSDHEVAERAAPAASCSFEGPAGEILSLQRAIGNAAVARMLAGGTRNRGASPACAGASAHPLTPRSQAGRALASAVAARSGTAPAQAQRRACRGDRGSASEPRGPHDVLAQRSHPPDGASRAFVESRIQRAPPGGKGATKAAPGPRVEPGEREEASKAQLRLVERIPKQEWLIYGFPIGGSEISGAEASKFISEIEDRLSKGHWVYVVGQDPLEVLGFSDVFGGPRFDNQVLRQRRAAKFCAGVKDHYADASKSYARLIRSCGAAPADQFVESNATRAGRAQNRGILIRRVAEKVEPPDEYGGYPYNPEYGPSDAHCAAYSTAQARDILGPVYANNAHCSCLVTPDEPHNNCVRHCLQDKMWGLLAYGMRDRKPNDPPMDINIACWSLWLHHRDCYRDCGCDRSFIDYLAFNAVCNTGLTCSVDSAAINLFNRCMPATKDDKYLKVD